MPLRILHALHALRRALSGPHPLLIRSLVDLVALGCLFALGQLAWAWAVTTETSPNALNWNTLVQTVFTFFGLVFTGVMAYYMARTKNAVEAAKTEQVKQTDVLKEVHVAVNSGRTVMEQEISRLTALVLSLAQDKAGLEEKARGAALNRARAEGVAENTAAVQVQLLDHVNKDVDTHGSLEDRVRALEAGTKATPPKGATP